jgi:hypothetical protein
MIDTIIGGAIAAVIGAVGYAIIGLWLEQRHEKAQQLEIVNALIVETAENLAIIENPVTPKIWYLRPYKLEAYNAYKGQLFFFPEDVHIKLVNAALSMESFNLIAQKYRSKATLGLVEIEHKTFEHLAGNLKSINEELRKWKAKRIRRWHEKVLAVCRRLRNFISKNRNNSKFDYS